MVAKDLLKQFGSLGSEQTRKTFKRHGITGKAFGVGYADLARCKRSSKLITSWHQICGRQAFTTLVSLQR